MSVSILQNPSLQMLQQLKATSVVPEIAALMNWPIVFYF